MLITPTFVAGAATGSAGRAPLVCAQTAGAARTAAKAEIANLIFILTPSSDIAFDETLDYRRGRQIRSIGFKKYRRRPALDV
jgi:hypothetical protein